MAFDLLELQSGNVICGRVESAADSIDGEIVLTKEIAGRIGGSFVYWLSQKVQKNPTMINICIGRDPRPSGDVLKEGVLEAVSLWGAKGHDAGIVVTDAARRSTEIPQFEFDGAVMITGGDSQIDINGFRFFTSDDEPDSEDIKEILRLAAKYNFIGGVYDEKNVDLMPTYAAYTRQSLAQMLSRTPGYFKDMHFLFDARCGSGGFFATDVIAKLGADISGSCNLDADSDFMLHSPPYDSTEVIEEMKLKVKKEDADLGIVFSFDAGKLAAVTQDDIIFADGNKVAEIVADVVSQKAAEAAAGADLQKPKEEK